jgi:hypothetical protein
MAEEEMVELGSLTRVYKEREAQRIAQVEREQPSLFGISRPKWFEKAEDVNGRIAMVAFLSMALKEILSGESFGGQVSDLVAVIEHATGVVV